MKLPDIIYKTSRKLGMARRPVPLEFPKIVDVGLTNFCNLKCFCCPNKELKKPRGFMSESLFKSLVDCLTDKFEAKSRIGIGVFGEDTLHPKFTDFLAYATSRGLKIWISTNFVEVSETIAKAIIGANVELIEISFYTLDRERYNQMVGREKYEQTLKNIHLFLKLAASAGFSGSIRLRPFKGFPQEMANYQKEFYQKYPGLKFERRRLKTIGNWAGFIKAPRLLNGIYVRVPCKFPFTRFVVDWDGQIQPCCAAMSTKDLQCGCITKDYDLSDFWEGEELAELREKFSRIDYQNFPSCRNCLYSRRYFPLRKD